MSWQSSDLCAQLNPLPCSLFSFLPDVSHVLTEFPAPNLEDAVLQDHVTLQDVKTLQLVYRRLCEVTVSPTRGLPLQPLGSNSPSARRIPRWGWLCSLPAPLGDLYVELQ